MTRLAGERVQATVAVEEVAVASAWCRLEGGKRTMNMTMVCVVTFRQVWESRGPLGLSHSSSLRAPSKCVSFTAQAYFYCNASNIGK